MDKIQRWLLGKATCQCYLSKSSSATSKYKKKAPAGDVGPRVVLEGSVKTKGNSGNTGKIIDDVLPEIITYGARLDLHTKFVQVLSPRA